MLIAEALGVDVNAILPPSRRDKHINLDCEVRMARKPTREGAGEDAMKYPLIQSPSTQGVNESRPSHRKPRKKGPQRRPKSDAAPEAFNSRESHTAAGVSPCRRRLYVGADIPKPPVMIARRLGRGDFAAGWQAEFGRRLSAARVGVDLSQRGLARKAGVRRPHLGKLEAGRMEPRLSTVFAIADALGVLARRLFPTMSWQTDDSITDL
jgi:DNA-binding XRE family transcriptional regulator